MAREKKKDEEKAPEKEAVSTPVEDASLSVHGGFLAPPEGCTLSR